MLRKNEAELIFGAIDAIMLDDVKAMFGPDFDVNDIKSRSRQKCGYFVVGWSIHTSDLLSQALAPCLVQRGYKVKIVSGCVKKRNGKMPCTCLETESGNLLFPLNPWNLDDKRPVLLTRADAFGKSFRKCSSLNAVEMHDWFIAAKKLAMEQLQANINRFGVAGV